MKPINTLLFSVLGALVVFLSAKLSLPLPGTDVPQSAQTLAILVIAAISPKNTGVYAVALYLLAGVIGLPVFSDGGHGISHLFGPTGGYLFGFFLAAITISEFKKRGQLNKAITLILTMLLAHVIILFFGWAWLSKAIGAADAFVKGVAPFIIGGIVKSIMAAGIIVFVQKYLLPKIKKVL